MYASPIYPFRRKVFGMGIIKNIKPRAILDSRGTPTVEVDVILEDSTLGRASVPSGASTGAHEMLEMRDNDPKRYKGKGVLKACQKINDILLPALKGMDASAQADIDNKMIELDGTDNKSHLGANSILGISMAVMKAEALFEKKPLYEYVGQIYGNTDFILPQVMFNVLNGGKHANWATDIQEYFIIPTSSAIPLYIDRLRTGAEIYATLQNILKDKGYTTSVGDEGGFAPKEMTSNTEPIEILLQAIEKAGYIPGKEVVLGFDAAASEFYENGKYILKKEDKEVDAKEWIAIIKDWCEKYPIFSLEDMLDEDDWDGWNLLMQAIGDTHQIVGDDLLVTNVERVQMAIEKQACNSLLVKVNQIGTITEAFAAIRLTSQNDWTNVLSHRSGETEDHTIADIVVGTGAGQIKTGALARGERTAKYNQLLRIEEQLGY